MRPDARWIFYSRKTSGQDELVDLLLSSTDCPEAKLFEKAKEIHSSTLKKQYVEASLIASNDLTLISDILDIPVEVLKIYAKMFYDIEGADKLTKLELTQVKDPAEKNMKLWALSQGLDFIAWRLGRQVSVAPVQGLQELFTTCIYKSKEALFSNNSSEASKESTKWVKLSMDIARLIKVWVSDTDAARKDLELALEEISPNFGRLEDMEDDMLDTGRLTEIHGGEIKVESSSIDTTVSLKDFGINLD